MSWTVAMRHEKPKPPPAITLMLAGAPKNGPCSFSVAFAGDLLAALGWKPGTGLVLFLGADEHSGRLRIAAAPKGAPGGTPAGVALTKGPKGSARLSYGRIAGVFDGLPAGKARLPYTIADGGVEFALPAASDWTARGTGKKRVAGEAAAPSTPVDHPPRSGAPAPGSDRKPAVLFHTIRGVTVDVTPGEESLGWRGKTMDVTTQQAAIAMAILRAAPAPVGEKFVCAKVWPASDAHAAEKMKVALGDLGKALEGLGLGLKVVKGVGLQITGLA